jgi:hypothetical protein
MVARRRVPGRKSPRGRRQKAAAFADYLAQRWSEGCQNATQLHREIRIRGFKGCRETVSQFVSNWRRNSRLATKTTNATEHITPKHAAILVTSSPERITTEQQLLFDRLTITCPDLVRLGCIAMAFRQALVCRDGMDLPPFLT